MPYKYSKNYSLLNILSLSQLESQIEPTFSFSDSLIQPYNDLCHRVYCNYLLTYFFPLLSYKIQRAGTLWSLCIQGTNTFSMNKKIMLQGKDGLVIWAKISG